MAISLTVSQVVNHIGAVLASDEVLSDICVRGEVSRATVAASGHCYFALKDDDSVLEGVIFRGGVGGEYVVEGDEVLAFGKVTVYVRQGRLQIISHLIQPSGAGALQAKFDQMKRQLEAEGLFDTSRKRRLPNYPSVIGVVTSEDSSVWQDIQRTASVRFPSVNLVLAHTLVQGDRSPKMIARALNDLYVFDGIEAVILARGGGSPEDLWPFNEEVVARAIFASPIPVVTGIGHETDWTIADMVGDLRASTPTGAVMQLIPDSSEVFEKIEYSRVVLSSCLSTLISDAAISTDMAVSKMVSYLPDLDNYRRNLNELAVKSSYFADHIVKLLGEEFNGLTGGLKFMSPFNTLERGYSIVERSADHKGVKSKTDVKNGDVVDIILSDGKLGAVIESGGNRLS